MSPSANDEVDILVVRAGTTLGAGRSDDEFLRGLQDMGLRVDVVTPTHRLRRLVRGVQAASDLSQAWDTHRAVSRRLQLVRARAIVYPTSLSTLFEPARNLRRAAVRFDALAAENRPGRRNLVQVALERRSLRLAGMVAPWSLRAPIPALLAHRDQASIVRLPPPVEGRYPPEGPDTPRRPTVLAYASQPEKKGLDVLVEAWRLACPPRPYQLLITGLDASRGRDWLRRRDIDDAAPGIVWSGALPAEDYRQLSTTASVVLSASRFEDFGLSQMEALADGALLVTVPSGGPSEAVQLLRAIAPEQIAADCTAPALAEALGRALALTEADRRDRHAALRLLLEPYSPAEFRRRLETCFVPVLLGPREATSSLPPMHLGVKRRMLEAFQRLVGDRHESPAR